MVEVTGGKEFERKMAEITRMLAGAGAVKVGFLSQATYPGGTPVAMIAAIQNYGAPRAGIPPRPFFSNMLRDKGPEWPAAIANLLRTTDYDALKVLRLTGEAIAGQLRQSIIDTNEPPLAPSTIKRKGHSKPLINTSNMINSIDYEIKTAQ